MKKILSILACIFVAATIYAGTTTNFGWNYGTKGQSPWWDIWTGVFQSIDTEVYTLKLNTNVLNFTADTTPTSDDLLWTVNDPLGTPSNKKMTIGNLFANAPPIKVLDPFTNEPINANALEITNAEVLSGSFHISQYRQDNEEPTETRKDQCLIFGYNSKKGGGVVLAGEHGMSFTFENYWHSVTEGPQCEFHLDYVAKDGVTTRRPIDCGVNLATHAVTLCLNAGDLYFQNGVASPYWQFQGGTAWLVGTTTKLVRDRNNYQFLQQKNAAGSGYPSLMYLNNSNRIVLGDDGSQSSPTAGIFILDPVGLIFPELASAPSGVANQAILYAVDNGAGKTKLMVQMPTGAAIQLVIEP